jgi:hypothetical protein
LERNELWQCLRALEASGRAINREDTMLYRQLIGAVALAVFAVSIGSAQVFDGLCTPI